MADRRAITCNYRETSKVAPAGALAWVILTNPGNAHDRIEILIRSRGGRLVRKWEDTRRLYCFRVKTLPPEHPRFEDERVARESVELELIQALNQAAEVGE